eukprot:TRINITY_DN3375_c0_g1_i1.p1 TRINITY_DN3375_c0_g1~~TRINITY_DN3375_c0_g1_i1.p1  ORF type:complete len:220 (-),score=43.67 TRINITY_DN3375_c0_g1_i1:37-696(-)
MSLQYQEEERDYINLFKILLIGDTTTGKSSIINKYADKYFSDEFVSTIGVDFKFKTIQKEEKKFKLQIWDTAGQERFKSIVKSFYVGAHLIILVFDLTDKTTFERLGNYFNDLNNMLLNNDAKRIIVGNKCDLIDTRQVERSVAETFSQLHGYEYFETSAKTGQGLNELFGNATTQLITKYQNHLAKFPSENKTELKFPEDQNDSQCQLTLCGNSCSIF